jgi:hypothetical protein
MAEYKALSLGVVGGEEGRGKRESRRDAYCLSASDDMCNWRETHFDVPYKCVQVVLSTPFRECVLL